MKTKTYEVTVTRVNGNVEKTMHTWPADEPVEYLLADIDDHTYIDEQSDGGSNCAKDISYREIA